MTTSLVAAEPLSQALALAEQAGDIAALKDVRAMATALQNGARARGMGIEQENKAAEVVLRSERGIGRTLNELRERGLYDTSRAPVVSSLMKVCDALAIGPATTAEIAETTGLPKGVVASQLQSHDFFFTLDDPASRAQAPRWRLDKSGYDEWAALRENLVTRASLGISVTDARNTQRLAALSDDEFEALLDQARESGRRIAKVNFYTAALQRKGEGGPVERPETPANADFDAFRRGAFGLLGWTLNDDGTSGATRNGLMTLPEDALRQTAQIIKALALAYNDVRASRG